MAFTHTTGEDFTGGGRFLEQPGWYHAVVTDATERPTKRDNSLIDNAMLRVDCTVLAGTSEGCVDKVFDLLFFHPNTSNKDGGEFGRKIIDRALVALGVIDPTDKQKAVSCEATDLVGRQFIVKMDNEERNGKTRLGMAYAEIYHVDDPAVKTQPRNEAFLSLLPASLRRIGSQAAAKPAPTPAPVSTPATAAAAAPLNADALDI